MFIISGAVVLAFLLVGVLFVDATNTAATGALDFIARYFGWFYVLAATFFLVFVIGIAVSRHGKLRLGPDDSRPEFSTTAWFAMLFTAGMGIGLVFYGVYEPAYHASDPPVGQGGTPAAVDQGMNWTLFHWGLHPWAIYCVLGLSMGYFCFRKGLPLRPASALYPLIGKRIYGWPGNLIDILAVFGTLFGLATSLGLGTQQINAGLETLFGFPNNLVSQVLIVAVITAVAVISVMFGIDKGIRRLSVLNLFLAVLLMLFIFIVGPKLFILTGLADYTGNYLQNIVGSSLTVFNPNTSADEFSWQSTWTLFYWGWWISWSPFVGMFVARISRGRTIRQFVTGLLAAPVGASIVWFTVLGGSGLFYETVTGTVDISGQDAELALFSLMEALPIGAILATIASVLAIVVVTLFFATSSDSGSLVVDMLTNGGDPHPIWQQRMFWAVLEGAITAVLLVVGGATALTALQAASITTGLPFAIVLLLVSYGLLVGLQNDRFPIPAVDRAGSERSGVSGYAASEGAKDEESEAPPDPEKKTGATVGD
ncbi:MAG: BCCT family transporter [Pseudonocardiaceae bacterium]|nr:BCCT family transporter [Pseudonocardiaceae bacterium]